MTSLTQQAVLMLPIFLPILLLLAFMAVTTGVQRVRSRLDQGRARGFDLRASRG